MLDGEGYAAASDVISRAADVSSVAHCYFSRFSAASPALVGEGSGGGDTPMLGAVAGEVPPVAGGKRKGGAPPSPITAAAPRELARIDGVRTSLRGLLGAASSGTTAAASGAALSPPSLAGVFFALDAVERQPASCRSADDRELLAAYSTGIALHRGSTVRLLGRSAGGIALEPPSPHRRYAGPREALRGVCSLTPAHHAPTGCTAKPVPHPSLTQVLHGGLSAIYGKLAVFCGLLGLPAGGQRSLTNIRLLAVMGDAFFTQGCAEKTTPSLPRGDGVSASHHGGLE